ncbi:MAG TPA: pilus assembly protein TadG-related protein [Pseudolysinimonas sp.]|nr:pilus assembly protein TadG-related protein [Pseudolysinimonas sp.]
MSGRPPALLRDDTGSTLPLIAFFGALALALVLVVAASTSLYLERKRLFTLADGAALAGAEAFTLDQVVETPNGPDVALAPDDVRTAVQSYLHSAPTQRFDDLNLDEATSVDGRSARVTLSSVWHPPLVGLFVPDGLRIDATATSRTVFG